MRQQAFEVHEASQVGQARRAVAQQAARLGFDEVTAGRAALITTELGHNLVRHARAGRLVVGARDDGTLELLSLDEGPGMADPERCLRDGYSTGATPGTGLGAVRRAAEGFGLYSREGVGTVVLARLGRPLAGGDGAQSVEWGGVNLPAPGETESGDAWCVHRTPRGATAVLLDGLGHGAQAAAAAMAGIAAFDAAPGEAPDLALERIHRALQGSRGAAGSVLALDADGERVGFAGVGNVTGRLLSGVADRGLLGSHGTLGLAMRRAPAQQQAWPPHALALLHSDGLASRWTLDGETGLLQQDPAIIAAWLALRHRRGRDDTSVVVLRRRPGRVS
jgi:anti-sigma regulatory factor (Ser/Thr protein kinase)